MSEPAYEERYCAFVDILGFQGLVAELNRGALVVDQVRELLRAIQSPSHDATFSKSIGVDDADLRQQSISDAICITASPTRAGLLLLFKSLEGLGLRVLHRGYFARGAVVKGRIYHDDHMAFGDALIQAYNLERTIVRFPRIMITRTVALDIDAYAANGQANHEFENFVGRAADGPHYFHILRNLLVLHNERLSPNDRSAIVTRFNETAEKIQARFDESADNPAHFDKVRWFADYWNDSISTLPQLKRIFGPGLALPPIPSYPNLAL
jgi:hypothetical protein